MHNTIASALNTAINRYVMCKDAEIATMITTNNMIIGEHKVIDASNVQEAINILHDFCDKAKDSVVKVIANIMVERLVEYSSIAV